jgi:hypothetical protein
MRGVSKPIKLTATPSWQELETHLQHGEARSNLPERHAIHLPALEPRPRGSVHSRQRGTVALPQSSPPTQRAQHPAELQVAHTRTVRIGAYQLITPLLPQSPSRGICR